MNAANYQSELAQLLEYVGRIAVAIRLHSAYRRKGVAPEAPEAQFDLLWLSESLHNFDMLGRAIADEAPEGVVFACDALIESYARYGTDSSGFNSKAAFKRVAKHGISLAHATNILSAMRTKAAAEVSKVRAS